MKCTTWVLLFLLGFATKAERIITDQDGIAVDIKANLSTLVHVHALWRHGDRTPIVLLPNDPANNEESWEIGLGELTLQGIKQAFRLGRLLRQRYDGFLSPNFKTYEICIRSTDINRTLMTAELVLQGLFPQKHLDKNLSIWHAIPVHTMEKNRDRQLRQNIDCPKAVQELHRVYETERVQNIIAENQKVLRFIGKHTGNEGTFDFTKIWNLFDPLEVITHHQDKHRFPEWVNQTIWEEIVRLYNLWCYFEYSTDLLKMLRGGELIKEILERLNELQEQRLTFKQKMYAYSAHDETVSVLLAVLGVVLNSSPPYTALVLLETHWISGELVIQLYYKNATDSNQIYRFPIGHCGDYPCTLNKLKAAMTRFISNNWEANCGLTRWMDTSYKQIGLYSSIFLTISALTMVFCHLLMQHLERRKMYAGRKLLSTDSEMGLLEERTLLTDQ